jgi:hypothetical protein
MRAQASEPVAEALPIVNGVGLTDPLAEALSARFRLHRLPEALDPTASVLVTLGAAVGPRLLDRLPRLKLVASLGAGYDHVDVAALRSRGTLLSNTPGLTDDCVADAAMGLLIAVQRRLVSADRFLRAGRWPQRRFPLTPKFSGRRLGIFGLGRIGMALAKRAAHRSREHRADAAPRRRLAGDMGRLLRRGGREHRAFLSNRASPDADQPGRGTMSALSNQRVAYFNGKIVPEREVVIPFRDRSFTKGDGVFDMTRSFNGRIFKIKEHIDRLYRSLRYTRIDCGLKPSEMIEISEDVLSRNRHLLGKDEDYWIGQRISRGVDAVGDEGWEHVKANVIVDCVPLPHKQRAKLYRDGMRVVVPPGQVTPSMALWQYLLDAQRAVVGGVVGAGERALGAGPSQHVELLRVEFLAPFVVAELHMRLGDRHASTLARGRSGVSHAGSIPSSNRFSALASR